MKIILFLTFLTNVAILTKAQSRFFEGKIADEENNILSLGQISVQNINNPKIQIFKIVAEDGSFAIPVDTLKGYFKITISHIGMDTLYDTLNFSENIRYKHYFLQKDFKQLSNVIVQGKVPLISRKFDKIVMNIENNNIAVGKDALNLLQIAPGVQLTAYDLLINGISGGRVYVNNRPLNFSGNSLREFLKSLKAEDIKEIEIIAHPSAEYSAEGVGGIINIITKKSSFMGLNGRIGFVQTFGLGKYPAYNPSTSINYKNKKINISLKYDYNNTKKFFEMTQDRFFDDTAHQSSIMHQIEINKAHYIDASLDYEINKHQQILVRYSGSFSIDTTQMNSETNMTFNNANNNTLSIGSFPSKSLIKYNDIGFNYSLITDTLNSKLIISGDYAQNKNFSKSYNLNKTYNNSQTLINDTTLRYDFPSTAQIGTVDINFTKNYKNGNELKSGIKVSYVGINTQNSYTFFKNNLWENSNLDNFSYNYKENINAAFIQLAGKVISIDYKTGIRLEYSNIDGILSSSSISTTNSQHYFNLFPSIFLGKNIDKKGNHNLSFTYTKRLSRPLYTALNPYKYYIDNYTFTTGNPNLKPAFSNSFELEYTFKNKYFLSLSYTYIKDQIARITRSYLVNYTEQTWDNIGKAKNYNLNISIPIKIVKWWEMNNSFLLQNKSLSSPDFNVKGTTFTFQNYNSFVFTNRFSGYLSTFYTPRSIYANMITGKYSDVSIGITYKLFKNRLLLSSTIYDMFYKNNPTNKSYYQNVIIYRHPSFQTRQLLITASYKFKWGKKIENSEVQKSNEDEKNRLK